MLVNRARWKLCYCWWKTWKKKEDEERRTAHAETAGEEKGSVQGGEDGDAKRGNYDWKRKGADRHNAEEEGGCALCAGDKVERKQGEGHW